MAAKVDGKGRPVVDRTEFRFTVLPTEHDIETHHGPYRTKVAAKQAARSWTSVGRTVRLEMWHVTEVLGRVQELAPE